MDPYRFDEWTKAFVAGTSRRAFLAGVLRAGVAAIGLAGVSAQTARADVDDDSAPREAKCQRRLDRCAERSSFKKCAECIDEVAALGCPVIAPRFFCACTSDTYCADGNACTLDICSSNICYNEPIGNQLSDCTECRNNQQCPNGGKCCKGRCCPAGTTCQTNAEGVGICCEVCELGDQLCCQQIRTAGDPNSSRDLVVALATCVGQEGAEAGLPTFCCGGCSGRWDDPTDPNSGPGCFCPVRSLP